VAGREEDCGFPAQDCNGRGQTSSLDEEVEKKSLQSIKLALQSDQLKEKDW